MFISILPSRVLLIQNRVTVGEDILLFNPIYFIPPQSGLVSCTLIPRMRHSCGVDEEYSRVCLCLSLESLYFSAFGGSRLLSRYCFNNFCIWGYSCRIDSARFLEVLPQRLRHISQVYYVMTI